jgi:hypothetical protein
VEVATEGQHPAFLITTLAADGFDGDPCVDVHPSLDKSRRKFFSECCRAAFEGPEQW